MEGSGACWPGPQTLGCPAQRLKCWSEDGNRLSWHRKAPPSETIQRPPRSIGGSGSSLVLRPGPIFLRRQVSRGLGARAPRAWGPAHQGPDWPFPHKKQGPFPHKNHISNYDFSQTWWGPRGKRSRDTPPTPPFPCILGLWRKEEGFHPLRLWQPSNTPPKVGGPKP